jgi:hypothetical protein
MALSENGQREAARPKIERSLSQNPKNPWAAHACAHLCYEEGDANAARAFLASWLTTYPRGGSLYSHLSWHLALGHLEAGDAAAALRLFREAFSPDVHSGPPRGKVTDPVSFLWRWELSGHPRDAEAWRIMHDFANGAFPRAGTAFSDMHIALAQAVAGNETALEAREGQIHELARNSRYPSGPLVPAVSRSFAAFERQDFSAVIDALEPIAGELERIGGSRAQLDLVEFTLLKAYVGADRLDDARPDAERPPSRLCKPSRSRVGGRALTTAPQLRSHYPLRYGFYLPTRGPTATRDGILALAREGERLGLHSAMIADHIVLPVESQSTYPYTLDGKHPSVGDALETFSILGVVAGATERLRLVTSVLVRPTEIRC